jgi:ABC-2 type transport system permease protein
MRNSSFNQLFLMNMRLVYRNSTGMFFTLVMPSLIYVALSILPIGSAFGAGAGVNYSKYVLPGIIAMTVMQGGIYGLAYWMIDLKTRGVIKRFLVTPLKQGELVISVLASRVIIALIQAVFLTIIGVVFFHVDLNVTMLLVSVFVAIGAAIFLLVGLLISMFADTYEAAAPITTAVGLPLTFLGNIFFPIDSLPTVLKIVGKILPITYLADGIRILFLSGVITRQVWIDLIILTGWMIVILALTLWKFRLKE